MLKKYYLILIFLVITFGAKAEGYRISVQWKGLEDSTIILAHYYNSQIYADDTIQLNSNGEGAFTGDKPLQQGLYVLYFNASNFFDFILGSDQNFEMKTSTGDLLGNLSFLGSQENSDFLNYQRTLSQKMTEKKALTDQLKSQDPEVKKNAQSKASELDKQVKQFIDQEIEKNPKNMYGLFLRLTEQLIVPEPPYEKTTPKYDSLAWIYTYNYRRDHFFDKLDFTDERMLFTQVLKPRLDSYFNEILFPNPDSIIGQAKKILKAAEPNPITFQYFTQYLLNNSSQSKYMGMDAVFLFIADNVYLNGKATWADSTVLRDIAQEAYLTRPNIIGNVAPDLTMENINGDYESIHLSSADFTILVFYEYDCGHCKEDIPKLYNDVYLNFLNYNIDVYAVCMNDNKAKWQEFVEKNQMEGWHHLWDPDHASKFRWKYNIKTTPTIYLLDREKKIVAKRIDNDNLSKFLNTLLKEN